MLTAPGFGWVGGERGRRGPRSPQASAIRTFSRFFAKFSKKENFAKISQQFSPPSRRLGGEAIFHRSAKISRSEIFAPDFSPTAKNPVTPEVYETKGLVDFQSFFVFSSTFSFLLTRFRMSK